MDTIQHIAQSGTGQRVCGAIFWLYLGERGSSSTFVNRHLLHLSTNHGRVAGWRIHHVEAASE